MPKRNKTVSVMLLLGLLLAACNKSDVNKSILVNFRTGPDGLVMKFFDNAPPAELFYTNDAQVPIGIEIHNQGGDDAYGVVLALNVDGFDDSTIYAGDGTYDASTGLFKIVGEDEGILHGKSIKNPNGELKIFTVSAMPLPPSPQAEQFKGTVIATACYNYKTQFFPDVCIDTDIYGTKQIPKICKPSIISGGSGQGGPVSIDSVDIQMLPQGNGVSPQFTITVKNIGNGEVILLGRSNEVCSQETAQQLTKDQKRDDFNIVIVSAYLAAVEGDTDTNKLSCYPKKTEIIKGSKGTEGGEADLFGYAYLKDKTATVTCRYKGTLPKGREGNYVTKLKVVADYGYTSSISKEVVIKVPLPKAKAVS